MADLAPHDDLAGYVLGTLTPAETTAFESHLAGCARCRAEVDDLGSLPSLLAMAAPEPPERLRQRTADAIRGGTAVVTPLRPRRSRTVRLVTAAAAALVIVAAIGVGAVLLGRDGRGTTTIALVASADAGSARGEATIREVAGGREIRMDVSGLPANPPGTFYECWLVGPQDSPQSPNRVSVGTFTVGADGTASVVWVSAADLARFPKMGVTLEPDDGKPGVNGPKYLGSP